MQNVMMNQLPELTIPLNRVISPTKPNASLLKPKRNPYITKWRCLFDTDIERTWMCFEPVCGRIAYPCYACKDMFEDRNSFLDHVNRRGFILKFNCIPCKRQYTFYNPCSFLLHARDHFNDVGGCIDLDHVSITTIPMDMAGLIPIASIPIIYETADSTVSYNLNLCSKFFKPVLSCIGKRFVYFKHGEVLFFPPKNRGDEQPLVLMQVNRFIPMCQFFPGIQIANTVRTQQQHQKNSDTNSETSTQSDDLDDIICLDDDDLTVETISPTKIQVKQMNSLVNLPLKKPQVQPCPECGLKPNFLLRDHFQADCKPSDDNNKCKKCGLISSSMCSLRAHLRYHEKRFPFICPECGKEYKDWQLLSRHVEDVCFHLAKTVKWKCPAKKCGKVFAQSLTFNAHFPVAHIKLRFGCKNCSEYFATEIEYDQHLKNHKDVGAAPYRNVHECMVCFVGINDVKSHTLSHIQDKENRTYVFICKFCRSHYRSTQTYAAHLLRCTKLLLNSQVKKEIEQIETHRDMKCKVIKYCKPCKSRIQITCLYKDIKNIATACPQCGTIFESRQKLIPQPIIYESTDNAFVRKDTETEHFECVLCLRVLTQPEQANYEIHDCKYKYPGVVITTPNFSIENYTIRTIHTTTTSPVAEDSSRRKRKRTSNHSSPKKRNSIAELTVNPVQFNGEYQCQLCDFKTTGRQQFHEHIQIHRDVSTSYQCMECGECFVVKPSFLKHLQVMHSIEDVESYLQENECFDKEAMKLLEESMRMVPGEATEPCEENQCRICRQMFPDTAELSKHFRTHGMAFLMKKIIK